LEKRGAHDHMLGAGVHARPSRMSEECTVKRGNYAEVLKLASPPLAFSEEWVSAGNPKIQT
jgi:hypothetical protein